MVDPRTFLFLALLSLFAMGCGSDDTGSGDKSTADRLTANDILRRSLQFHDPTEAWGQQNLQFVIDEPRVGFSERQSTVTLGLSDDYFTIIRSYDGVPVVRHLRGDSCTSTVAGKTISPADTAAIARYGLQCERTQGFFRFYRLLNGMPMSLFSPDISLNETVTEATVDNFPCYRLTARLNQEVIAEEWYFYFDQRDYRLRGYGYASQEAGEYLRIDGLVEVAQMQLPRMRHWYSQADSAYLGSDILVEVLTVDESNSAQ